MPLRPDRRRKGCRDVTEIEHVLERERVVHGAALEVASVFEDLLRHLPPQDTERLLQPRIRLLALEKRPSEEEGLCVREEMIAEKMPLQTPREPTRLHRQARYEFVREIVAAQRPFDPVDDAQRGWIRLPRGARARRIFLHPSQKEGDMPVLARVRIQRIEIVEVVQVITPELLE